MLHHPLLRELAGAFDRPDIPWKTLILGATISRDLLQGYRAYKRIARQSKKEYVDVLRDISDEETVQKSLARDRKINTSAPMMLAADALFTWTELYFNFYATLWTFYGNIEQKKYSPSAFNGEVTQSILVAGSLWLMNVALFGIPMSVMVTAMGKKERAGAPSSVVLALGFASQIFLTAIVAPVGSGLLKFLIKFDLMDQTIALWIMSILMLHVREFLKVTGRPLYVKSKPMEEGPLRRKIETLAQENKITINDVRVVHEDLIDGSKSVIIAGFLKKNVYVNDAVLAKEDDAEIAGMNEKEILAMTAEAIGRSLYSSELAKLLLGYVDSWLSLSAFIACIDNTSLFKAFGFESERPILIAYLLNRKLHSPLLTFIGIYKVYAETSSTLRADAYAKKIGFGSDLAFLYAEAQNISTKTTAYGTLEEIGKLSIADLTFVDRLLALGWPAFGKKEFEERRSKKEKALEKKQKTEEEEQKLSISDDVGDVDA